MKKNLAYTLFFLSRSLVRIFFHRQVEVETVLRLLLLCVVITVFISTSSILFEFSSVKKPLVECLISQVFRFFFSKRKNQRPTKMTWSSFVLVILGKINLKVNSYFSFRMRF
jgi:hypothetical protein